MTLPPIIQGGMGVAVSNWKLARAVSSQGQLGVVSGTLLPVVFARRLQLGDPDGNLRLAARAFPDPSLAHRVLQRFFIPSGKPADAPFAPVPLPSAQPSRLWTELTVLANFAEVWLAKLGHSGRVGLNLLEKIQIATLPSLYGAMLAGVDVVLMGAGIPRAIPGILDRLAAGQPAEITLDIHDASDPPASPVTLRLDPADVLDNPPASLARPAFLAIVGSAALATNLARKSSGRLDGFVVEGHTAGGHNAPPRGGRTLDSSGQPIYGPRDEPELAKFRALGLPFWLAGERASPDSLATALAEGAAGVQIGTAFAFCLESGLDPDIKNRVLQQSLAGEVAVFTDPDASPTGFPFKVVALPGSLSEPTSYTDRERRCDLGYLRESYARPDGSLGYRCPAEPPDAYAAKGGDPSLTTNRKCLCNGLLAAIGLGQVNASGPHPVVEPAIVTAGQEATSIARFLAPGATSYSARDVLATLLPSLAFTTSPATP